MKNSISKILLKISSCFFDMAVFLHRDNRVPVDFDNIKKYQKCDCGIFIKKETINGVYWGMFANSQIGFFYKECIYSEEITNLFASEKEVTEIKQYLIDKIFECHEHIEKLEKNEIQPSLPN